MMRALPEQWKSRTQFKFIPASFLATADTQFLEKISLETFNLVLFTYFAPFKTFLVFNTARQSTQA